jgi:hypothetical protein
MHAASYTGKEGSGVHRVPRAESSSSQGSFQTLLTAWTISMSVLQALLAGRLSVDLGRPGKKLAHLSHKFRASEEDRVAEGWPLGSPVGDRSGYPSRRNRATLPRTVRVSCSATG